MKSDAGQRYLARQILLYVDDAHLMPFDRPRAFEGLRDLVYKLSPSDQVALFRYNQGATRVLVPFTSSKEALLDGISKLEKMAPSGLSWYTQADQDYRLAPRVEQRRSPGGASRPELRRAGEGSRRQRPRRPPPRHRRPSRRARASGYSSTSGPGSSSTPARRWPSRSGIAGFSSSSTT